MLTSVQAQRFLEPGSGAPAPKHPMDRQVCASDATGQREITSKGIEASHGQSEPGTRRWKLNAQQLSRRPSPLPGQTCSCDTVPAQVALAARKVTQKLEKQQQAWDSFQADHPFWGFFECFMLATRKAAVSQNSTSFEAKLGPNH